MQVINENKTPDFAQPALHYQSPNAVLSDPDLEPHEKRAILSSWASDLYAVESCPWLRDVPSINGRLRLSDILEALRVLDEDDDPPPRGGAAMRVASVGQLPTRAASTSTLANSRRPETGRVGYSHVR